MPSGVIKKLQELVESVYLVKDPYITEVILATVIAHRLKNDPVWIIIVAESGGAKSEFVNMISNVENVFPLSTLTSHTFVSGQKAGGTETSLLSRIQDGIITFKDFTSLLSEHQDDRSVIMGQLREIYDGRYSKAFGTGQTVSWEGKITILAGATHVIHSMKQSYTAMGERFLLYNMIQPERKDAARRNMNNQEEGDIREKRALIAEAVRKLLDEDIKIPEIIPKISDELKEELLDLAELATRARSETERNYRSPQQEITEAYPPEMPTRFAGQLQNFAKALMILSYNEVGKTELLDKHRHLLYKIALDSVTKSKRTAMIELSRYDEIETAGLATKIGFPTNTIRRWMEDLAALGVARRDKRGGSKGDVWSILPKYRDIMRKFEKIDIEGGILTEESIIYDDDNKMNDTNIQDKESYDDINMDPFTENYYH